MIGPKKGSSSVCPHETAASRDLMGEFVRGLLLESPVRTALIIFPSPGFDRLFCLFQGAEPMHVQTFGPQGYVEGFDVGVVGRLARPSRAAKCSRADGLALLPARPSTSSAWSHSHTSTPKEDAISLSNSKLLLKTLPSQKFGEHAAPWPLLPQNHPLSSQSTLLLCAQFRSSALDRKTLFNLTD
jgi:hypothetical protein